MRLGDRDGADVAVRLLLIGREVVHSRGVGAVAALVVGGPIHLWDVGELLVLSAGVDHGGLRDHHGSWRESDLAVLRWIGNVVEARIEHLVPVDLPHLLLMLHLQRLLLQLVSLLLLSVQLLLLSK